MNRSVLLVYVLMLISLLSCDVDNMNALMSKTRDKFVDKKEDKKDLGVMDKTQEGIKEQKDVVQKNLKEREKQVLQAVSVKSVNVESSVILNSPYYYSQKEMEIKEEELVPSTDEEKEAQKEIEKVENILGDFEFDKLIEDTRKIKSEYEELESSFYSTLSDLINKRGSYPKKDRKRQQLIQLYNQLNEERSHIDMLSIKVDSGLYGLGSAKSLFERAQNTLKEAIIKRLKNKHRSYWVRTKVDSDLLAKRARSEAKNSLDQLESASSKIGEAIGRKKDIEELIQEAKSVIVSFKR